MNQPLILLGSFLIGIGLALKPKKPETEVLTTEPKPNTVPIPKANSVPTNEIESETDTSDDSGLDSGGGSV